MNPNLAAKPANFSQGQGGYQAAQHSQPSNFFALRRRLHQFSCRFAFRRDLCNGLELLHVTQTCWPPATALLAGFSHGQNSSSKKTTEQSLKEIALCLPYGALSNYTHILYILNTHMLATCTQTRTTNICAQLCSPRGWMSPLHADTYYLHAGWCLVATHSLHMLPARYQAPLINLGLP